VKTLTIREKILLHLDRFIMVSADDAFSAPWDLTQDGIATTLRISRAHASIELKKLKVADKIFDKHVHVKGGKARRKSYFLTPLGIADVAKIKKSAADDGVDIMPLLDMRRCDPNTLMNSIDDESKITLGLACVFRCSIRRSELPDTKQAVIPVDASGMIAISDDVKKRVLSVMTQDQTSEMHSKAADYWLSKDRQERLYHLVKAGRITDACRLLINDRDYFMDLMNEDLLNILEDMSEIPERMISDVIPIKIETELEFGEISSAKKSAELLMTVNREVGVLHMADVLSVMGDSDAAILILQSIGKYSDKIESDLRMARCLTDMSEFKKAEELLVDIKSAISLTGNAEKLTDVYLMLGTIYIRTGEFEKAISFLNKAKSSANRKDLKKVYQKLSETYEKMGMMEGTTDKL